MKIAIVNEDTGTTVRDEAINVGNEVIETLRTNKSFTWVLQTEKEAKEHLKMVITLQSLSFQMIFRKTNIHSYRSTNEGAY